MTHAAKTSTRQKNGDDLWRRFAVSRACAVDLTVGGELRETAGDMPSNAINTLY